MPIYFDVCKLLHFHNSCLFAFFLFQILPAAGSNQAHLVPYGEFVAHIHIAQASEYIGHARARVENSSAFEEMRRYLAEYYDGIIPSRSFAVGDQIVDCVPLLEQPSLRSTGKVIIAAPPPNDPDKDVRSEGIFESEPNAKSSTRNVLGEFDRCTQSTIPLRRITLEEMVRFRSVKDFLRKGPEPTPPHEYAHARQFVDNWGGNASLNLWKTAVNTDRGEVFSLAQHWYAGGSGSQLQTAETGWTNFPDKFGSDPVLFIFWTADNYQNKYCYNLECKAFVQVNNTWCLGCGFDHYSQTQGPQYEIRLGYYLYQGNWWLKFNHSWKQHETEWIGYYPASIYEGGQMSQNAQEIDFGGEVSVTGTSWPCMGSCHFADTGFRSAAYVRRIVYRGDQSNRHYKPSLDPNESNPACYTITQPTDDGDDWKTHFFFGGPGGNGC